MNEPAISEYKLYQHGELVALKHANRFEVVNQRLFTKCLEVPTKAEIMREFHQLIITPEFIKDAKDREIIPHDRFEKLAWGKTCLFPMLFITVQELEMNLTRKQYTKKKLKILIKKQSRLYCEIKLLIDDAIQKGKVSYRNSSLSTKLR